MKLFNHRLFCLPRVKVCCHGNNQHLMVSCSNIVPHLHTPQTSTSKFLSTAAKQTETQTIKRNAWISVSQNIFTNLALEDWIYNNLDFTNEQLLVMWRNQPCVVIGCHQNPWLECAVYELGCQDVALARRRSGGGTVYHDLGNLNCTFFTSRKAYNRKANLEFIVRCLQEKYNLPVCVSERDDILLTLNGQHYKISGSSSKLGRTVAYHHCTLLFQADTETISSCLHSNNTEGVSSKATESVRSAVSSIDTVLPGVDYSQLVQALTTSYLQHTAPPVKAQYVDPSRESHFKGLRDYQETLKTWDWIYGKTPKFTVTRNFSQHDLDLFIKLEVVKGILLEVELNLNSLEIDLTIIVDSLKGQRFWPSDIAATLMTVSTEYCDLTEEQDSVLEWVKQSVQTAVLGSVER